MKNRIVVAIIMLCCLHVAYGQPMPQAGLKVDSIPADLKKDAEAVYRLDETIVQVISPSKYTEKIHSIITILNKEGAWHLAQRIWFDKFNSIDEIDLTLFDANGAEVQKFKKKDFSIQNYYDGISLATDDKLLTLSLTAASFPCTIDVKCTRSNTSYINLPEGFINNANSSVEKFSYAVTMPVALDIRHTSENINLEPTIVITNKTKTYTWEKTNVPVSKIEAGGYEIRSSMPCIKVCPTAFEYDGYKGAFNDWKEFGTWCYSLYDQENAFTTQRVAEIKALVKELPDKQAKIRVLYDYLKNNMRYISIQFGIGGFKPFSTTFVDDKKYGDCKALTNYMRNLLKVAGIKSYPALINGGYNNAPVNPGFPQNSFNHVILCIPNDKDSTWLECTSTHNEAGYLGSFTENKNALLLTETGGVIVPTPRSDYKNNELISVNNIFINEDGGAEVKTKLTSTGSFYSLLNEVSNMETEQYKELFVNYLHFKEPDQFSLEVSTGSKPKNEAVVSLKYNNFFDFKAGSKLFFPKSVSTLCNEKLYAYQQRNADYVFHDPFTKVDTTIFHLPVGMKVENLLTAKEIITEIVSYKREVNHDVTANTIRIISSFYLKKNIIKPADYASVSTTINTINKEENTKLVLVQ